MTPGMDHRELAGRTVRRRSLAVGVGVVTLLGLSATPASAHRLTIQPPGADGPVVDQAVSNAWAQAHCHAQSPATTHETSGGVVVFTPQGVFACPEVANPGGQVHPHVGQD